MKAFFALWNKNFPRAEYHAIHTAQRAMYNGSQYAQRNAVASVDVVDLVLNANGTPSATLHAIVRTLAERAYYTND